MGTPTPQVNDLALEGLAGRTVQGLAPHWARIIVRLPTDARREVISEHLQQLVSVNAITSEQAQRLTPGGATAPPAPEASAGGGPRPLSVFSVLSAAAAASPTDESGGSIIDALFDLAMTVVGAIVGDVIAGPAGAIAGGAYAHQWASDNPPSTWFE